MKPFNLEQALAGEPVKLRNGLKAYIKYVMPEEYVGDYPLRGFYLTNDVDAGVDTLMWKMGSNNPLAPSPQYNIIGMWEEPRPRVQLDLPCPIAKVETNNVYSLVILLNTFNNGEIVHSTTATKGIYFATKEDAQEWLKAMENARR